jgi:hypothetical protein
MLGVHSHSIIPPARRPLAPRLSAAPGNFHSQVKFSRFFPMCTDTRMPSGRQLRTAQRGSSLIEFVLLFPVLFFLLVGAFDIGFFCYAMIAVEDAARVAALHTSSSSATSANTPMACADVLSDLQMMPNHSRFALSCNASPLRVTAASISGPDGTAASKVTVTYDTMQLIPIPGLAGHLSITRSVQMRVRS